MTQIIKCPSLLANTTSISDNRVCIISRSFVLASEYLILYRPTNAFQTCYTPLLITEFSRSKVTPFMTKDKFDDL